MMNDIEMDLYITQVEGRIMKRKLKEAEDEIANLRNHVKALQVIIENQRKQIESLGGDCNGK